MVRKLGPPQSGRLNVVSGPADYNVDCAASASQVSQERLTIMREVFFTCHIEEGSRQLTICRSNASRHKRTR